MPNAKLALNNSCSFWLPLGFYMMRRNVGFRETIIFLLQWLFLSLSNFFPVLAHYALANICLGCVICLHLQFLSDFPRHVSANDYIFCISAAEYRDWADLGGAWTTCQRLCHRNRDKVSTLVEADSLFVT